MRHTKDTALVVIRSLSPTEEDVDSVSIMREDHPLSLVL